MNTIKSIRHVALGVALFGGLLRALAQPLSSADTDWQKLSVRATAQPAPIVAGSSSLTVATDVGQPSLRDQTVGNLLQTARDAKVFYTKYPTDPRAKDARKLEAVATIQSAEQGAVQQRVTGMILGDAFRADKSNPVHDRFDVALTTEIMQLEGVLRGQRLSDNGAAAEEVGDRLYKEFGGTPEVVGYYLSVMRTTDRATAVRLAAKLQTLNLPKEAQDEAKSAQARYARIGKTVEELIMATTDGKKIDFQAIKQPTVVYFWDPSGGTDDLTVLSHFKSGISAGIKWIYIGLGAAPKNLQNVNAATPFEGQLCFDASALGSAAAVALCVTQTPQVAVIADGSLVGVGDPASLPSILATINR